MSGCIDYEQTWDLYAAFHSFGKLGTNKVLKRVYWKEAGAYVLGYAADFSSTNACFADLI
jgi:hypothetical protein